MISGSVEAKENKEEIHLLVILWKGSLILEKVPGRGRFNDKEGMASSIGQRFGGLTATFLSKGKDEDRIPVHAGGMNRLLSSL